MSSETKYYPWDAAVFLKDRGTARYYLQFTLEENDADALQEALEDLTRSKGMAKFARETNLDLEALRQSVLADKTPLHRVAHPGRKEIHMSLINKQVSDFTVQAYHDDEFKEISLKDTLGKWAVYFFYPADFTFVCPTELEDLADHYDEFQKLGVEIYSVSTDTHFVHKAWHDESKAIGKIRFPMLADPNHVVSRDFEVYIESQGVDERGTFIVNPEGTIVAYEVNAGNIGRNSAELLRKIQACQFVAEHGDMACPARWQPGQSTLKPGIDLVGKI